MAKVALFSVIKWTCFHLTKTVAQAVIHDVVLGQRTVEIDHLCEGLVVIGQ